MTLGARVPTLRRVPSNGIAIAVHDWDGAGRPVLLVHGNSFLGRLWDVTARDLLPDYRPIAMDLRGHGDSDVPAQGYTRQDHAADITGVVEALGLETPLVLAHSVGAVSSLVAAGNRPDLFSAMMLVEPVIRPKVTDPNWLPSPTVNGIADAARKRRHTWPSADAAYDNYRTKPAFADWSPDVLRLYVEEGFRPQPDGTIELKCPGWVEAQGYEVTPSTNPWPLVPAISIPVLVVRGGSSRVFSAPIAESLVAELPNGRLLTYEARSHALPMEEPLAIAETAKRFFAEVLAEAPSKQNVVR
jgi:pimeloyl-ACP methyl ester carboxylesterase